MNEYTSYLINKINIITNSSFRDLYHGEEITSLENFLNSDLHLIDNFTYFNCISRLIYFYGKTHQYSKAKYWSEKLINIQDNNDINNWIIFVKTLFPIIIESYKEESVIIETLKNNLDFIYNFQDIKISNLLFLEHSFWYAYIDNNPIELYERYVKLQIKAFPSIYSQKLINENIINNKIKIGIISANLIPYYNLNNNTIHGSSISDSFYSTFLNLSSELFEVIFIYIGKENKDFKDKKNIYIPKIEPCIEDIKKVQIQIANLNLDILLYIDLHIESSINFVALSKLAKIQICTHGHPVTSGIPRNIMNYYISWEAAEIENAQEHYTEELVLISKDIMWEHFIPRNLRNVSMLTGINWGNMKRNDLYFLPNNIDYTKNWYFCAQATFKFNYNFDIILKNILIKDKNSIIFLIKNDNQLYSMNSEFIKRLYNKEIDLNRIIFLEKMKHHNMMALYNNIDVVLDSFFFGGDTTTREAFEVGAPIITLPHKYLGSRWTYAYYNYIGITELIADNIDNYIDIAVKVGTNKIYCNELKEKIKKNSYKLFYSTNASKCWEDVFLKLYNKEQKILEENILEENILVENILVENILEENEKIPKIIIQTWKDDNLSEVFKYLSDKIKNLHPDFEYKFFTDKDIELFIKENYFEYYNLFNNFKYPIQKFDFFRYLAVYHYGGFYLDMDMDMYINFEELCKYNCIFPQEFKQNTDFYLQNNGMKFLLGNYAFAASKKNKFLKYCIDNIVNDSIFPNIDNFAKEKYVYYKTGPVLVSASYMEYINTKFIHILEDEKDECFGIYGQHLHMGSWKNQLLNNLQLSKKESFGGTELLFKRISNKINLSNINLILDTNIESQIIDKSKKILYWFHNLPSDPMYKNFDKKQKIIFVSEYQKDKFINYYNLDKENCFVIKNCIVPFPKHVKDKSICRLIYHSTPNRGLDILIEVFSKLLPIFEKMQINIHLDVYSSFKIYNRTDLDECEYFQLLYERIKNNSNMTYHGYVENEEIRQALINSNIFVYPSTYEETSCLCLIEAMSAGCICVHSSLGALPETSNNYTYMYKYDDNKLEHCTLFAESLIKAVSNYKNISLENQINYANNSYNLDIICEEWKKILF